MWRILIPGPPINSSRGAAETTAGRILFSIRPRRFESRWLVLFFPPLIRLFTLYFFTFFAQFNRFVYWIPRKGGFLLASTLTKYKLLRFLGVSRSFVIQVSCNATIPFENCGFVFEQKSLQIACFEQKLSSIDFLIQVFLECFSFWAPPGAYLLR